MHTETFDREQQLLLENAELARRLASVTRELHEERRARRHYQDMFHRAMPPVAPPRTVLGDDGRERDSVVPGTNPAVRELTGLVPEQEQGRNLHTSPGAEHLQGREPGKPAASMASESFSPEDGHTPSGR